MVRASYDDLLKTAEFMAKALEEAEPAVHGALAHQAITDALSAWRRLEAGPELADTATFDSHGCFVGHSSRECGEHRTVGEHRAWCHDCGEWCYPTIPCARCERPRD